MKIKLMLALMFFIYQTIAGASTRQISYDGNEILINLLKDHKTEVIFPEKITSVVRGYGTDNFVIQRLDSNKRVMEIIPADLETGEMTVSGTSGEIYSLKFSKKEDFDTKVSINLPTSTEISSTNSQDVKKIDEKIIESKNAILPVGQAETSPQQLPQQTQPKSALNTNHDDDLKKDDTRKTADLALPAELNRKVTLKGNELPLKIYLKTIAAATGYNVIATQEIENKKVSLSLENIEVWRALKSLLYPLQYGFKVTQEDLIISDKETRIYEIQIPGIEQNFSDLTSNESFTQNQSQNTSNNSSQSSQDIKTGTKIVLENKSPALSLWSDLENSIKNMLSAQDTYSINKTSGSVIVTATPGTLDKVGEMITSINKKLNKQQSFEIQIIEVSLNNNNEFGIDWSAVLQNAGRNLITASTNFTAAGFVGGQLLNIAGSKNGLNVVLKALEEQGHVEVRSKPSITVSNMIPCILQEGTSKTYISGSGQTFNNNVTSTNLTTSQVQDGLTLRLIAKISDTSKSTVLNLSAAITSIDRLDNIQSGGVTIQVPTTSTKSITTNVSVEEGNSLIIGGLISTTNKNTTQAVPGISHIPFIGNAFKYKGMTVNKSELVIIITPKQINTRS